MSLTLILLCRHNKAKINVVIDLTANTSDTNDKECQQNSELEFGLNIQPVDKSDSEPENYFPTYFIHELNDCLSLQVSDAENYMSDIDREYTSSKIWKVYP